MGNLLLGIDIGTYSSKGVLCLPDGTVLAEHTLEHDLALPHPGWAEQDADRVWWEDCANLCRILPAKAGRTGSEIGAVAVSGLGPDLLPLDDQGRPLRPAILYGIDTRAQPQIDRLNELFGPDNLNKLSGMNLTSQAIGPKLRWLREAEPEVYRRTRYVHSCSSYLVYRLTGEYVLDYHTASHFNPLFDIERLEWSEKFAGEIFDLKQLPRLAWPTEIVGEISAKAAAETGLAAGTPVTCGTIDAVSEGLSVGVTRPGDLMLMYGTTFFFILALEKMVSDPRMWLTAFALPGRYCVAGGMSTTGALTRWFRDQLAADLLEAERQGGPAAYSRLGEEATGVPPGSRGLLVLPYFHGERTPIHDPFARGIFAGLTLNHTRADMFRAALEGIAYGVRQNVEVMREMGADPRRLVAVGGGTKNRTWLQIVSDVTGLPQDLPARTIGASYGDAFLAGYASGLIPDFTALDREWVRDVTQIEPNPANAALYREYFEMYTELYKSTAGIMHRLGRLAKG